MPGSGLTMSKTTEFRPNDRWPWFLKSGLRYVPFLLLLSTARLLSAATPYWIHIVDDQTHRGVPAVQLSTTDPEKDYWTDSNDIAVIEDGALQGRDIQFKANLTSSPYRLYNVLEHPFFDSSNGCVIYLEGTFTAKLSSAKVKVPDYDYNQLMYRLDLNDPRLDAARLEWSVFRGLRSLYTVENHGPVQGSNN